MLSLLTWLARIIAGMALIVVCLWVFGPYETVNLEPSFDSSTIGEDLDAYFAKVESRYTDITPGVEKRVLWAGESGQKTEWSVLYVHGFSATSEEIRPVPDKIAETLKANLIFTRLRGHGRGSDALAEATVQDWMNDLAEGLAAARIIGEKVLIIATSTGGTIVTAGADDAALMEQVEGIVMVSPNFGINNPLAPLLTWPAARYWLPTLAGERRSFEPRNPQHAKYWTTEYPSVAVMPMAAMVADVRDARHENALVPVLFYLSPNDTVVRPDISLQVAKKWGAGATVVEPELGPEDDSNAHVIAGDILSPGNTSEAVETILEWVGKL